PITRWVKESDIVRRLATGLAQPKARVQVEGGFPSVWAALLAALLTDFPDPVLVIAPNDRIHLSLLSDLQTLLTNPDRVTSFPENPSLLAFEEEVAVVRDRLLAVSALQFQDRPIVVTTPVALRQPTIRPDLLSQTRLCLRRGETVPFDHLVATLKRGGYERVSQVEKPGQFAVRGGLVDLFSLAEERPVRVEFFGDQVDSLRFFDLESQLSVAPANQCWIIPCREFLLPDDPQSLADAILAALEAQAKTLEEQGKGQQSRLLRSKVERDAERIRSGTYFEGITWYRPFANERLWSLVDHLPEKTVVIWLERNDADGEAASLDAKWEKTVADLVETGDYLRPPVQPFLDWDEGNDEPQTEGIKERLSRFRSIELTSEVGEPSSSWHLTAHRLETFVKEPHRLAARMQDWWNRGFAIGLATRHPKGVEEWLSVVADSLPCPVGSINLSDQLRADRISILPTPVSGGFVWQDTRLAIVTDSELFRLPFKPRRKRWRATVAIHSPSDLRIGQLVVHIHHGIGIYRGLIRQTVLGKESDYLVIEYAEGEKLYVPVHQIDRVRAYRGVDGEDPALSSLSAGRRWLLQRKKALENAEKVAKDLLEIYARRKVADGFAFSPDSPWQREMEDSFPYEETEDQLRAIEEVKSDMESPTPMNRLVCGDVGFGKTEIAVRAAFKAVQDGKQVAVLVPTTVLALQHSQTFASRLAPYPVKVAMLSRLRPLKEQKKVLEDLKLGAIDIVIGTHRLLSEDVQFRDLGLVIIDEEQRFGVRQKESLKRFFPGVDLLILTATPIPRTLHMALGGLTDLSLINSPPEGRRPVQTYLSLMDPELIRFALLRELERGGQVYYVYNRVQGIEHIAEKVCRLVPQAKVTIAHGQMPEDQLERVMMEFAEGKWDVLVCTTIIENGLDVANANTLIVERAERFGLAQLYQLRGRIGRSDRQAYAYFFHEHPKRLTEVARRRLEALREFTDLASGFRLAIRDLEVRGAGNLLGTEQHGFINAVGFDLYMEMLSQAVQNLRGEPTPTPVTLPEADLPVKAFIPEDYVEETEQRLYLYRRMTSVQTEEDVNLLLSHMRDRFGPLPQPVLNILSVLRIRIRAYHAGVSSITHDRQWVTVRWPLNLNLTNVQMIRLYTLLTQKVPAALLRCCRYEGNRFLIDWTEMNSGQLLTLLEELTEAIKEFVPKTEEVAIVK
ncbi:MAG: transcription-repair coupling factor, partial [Armatimonadetes bacterium]|nr:transcription-repair coupling factor [Armatimonadota bacterium]MDW8123019.1 transcription-repair coupling factor [Armatimonadota bacterium]